MIATRDNLTVEPVEIAVPNCETVWTIFTKNNGSMYVGSFYRKPNEYTPTQLESLEGVLQQVTDTARNDSSTIILGDRAATSTDFRNRLTVPPNSNRIRLTNGLHPPMGPMFPLFTGSDSPPGPSRLSLQVVSLLVSNQNSFTQIKRQSKIITCGVLMHKNKSLT